MGWTNSHLHAFEVGRERYGEPDPGGELEFADEGRVKISQVAAGGHKKFTYTYDFGDDWRHAIVVEKVLDAEPGVRYPRCVAGKRACPPDDCGGPWGYADFLEAVRTPGHERHREVLEWVGGPFDPEQFDAEYANKELRAVR